MKRNKSKEDIQSLLFKPKTKKNNVRLLYNTIEIICRH